MAVNIAPTMLLTSSRNVGRRLPRNIGRCLSSGVGHSEHEAWLFVDSIYPIQLARWDFRHYIGILRSEYLLSSLKSRLDSVKTHNFNVVSLEPHQKDGGVFVRFKYSASDPNTALQAIEKDLNIEAEKHGGLPSWSGLGAGSVWLVKGTPWREDMDRFASPIVQVTFEGPDVPEQALYDIFRPCGRIRDLALPSSVPPGSPRSSRVTFQRIHSATIARNVVHGLKFPTSTESSATRLRMAYQRPVQPHVIRDWMSSHPKITLPLLVFLLGTLTYAIFDPLRSLMVQGKMLNWFDFREFQLYKWLRLNTLDRLTISSQSESDSVPMHEEVWKERKEAEGSMKAYLTDMPATVAFVHGPKGSGKTSMLLSVLKNSGRKILMIDLEELQKAQSDSQLVGGLATQTGYWPVFTFLNSMNNLIDLASVGLIGQKAGLSTSLPNQMKNILEVVSNSLKAVRMSHQAQTQREIKKTEAEKEKRQVDERRKRAIQRGTWHDGRLDCVAGNGVMSELGIGDEILQEDDGVDEVSVSLILEEERKSDNTNVPRRRSNSDVDAVNSLPIVIIKNYASNGGQNREEVLDVFAGWAAMLAENQVAHVVVISDNRENLKQLAKALPSKALHSIALSDADTPSSLSFVRQKLREADANIEFTADQTAQIERLGGRASDLESLIHKVKGGQAVGDAVEDIINRGVAELRKKAFGDDVDDAKGLPWTREQAWTVLKLLSKQADISYYDTLLEFPFKGDEGALRGMEHAELISIGTIDGRPSTIRPGKPVFKWVFKRLVNDPVLQTTQDIALNEKIITSAEKTIQTCEEELLTLKQVMGAEAARWWPFAGKKASTMRARILFDRMGAAEAKVEKAEKSNRELKKLLYQLR